MVDVLIFEDSPYPSDGSYFVRLVLHGDLEPVCECWGMTLHAALLRAALTAENELMLHVETGLDALDVWLARRVKRWL